MLSKHPLLAFDSGTGVPEERRRRRVAPRLNSERPVSGEPSSLPSKDLPRRNAAWG